MFGERENRPMSKKANPAALLPILVFLVLYLGLGLIFEYVLKIPMGFYSIPIVVIFLIALLVACCQNRALSFDEKLTLMGHGVGDKNIITMLLIFLAAGMFVGVVGRSSAESVAYFMLSIIPSKFAVAVLFVVSCFVSTAMGTSVGTITLIVPIAIPIAAASGYSLPLCIASVMGGAMFGDNLSFISDTTIAACNGQGCAMKDKFRENFHIAFPAALASLALILVLTLNADVHPAPIPAYNLIQIIPYVLVLIGGIIGINVFVVLLIGIVSGAVIALATGATGQTGILAVKALLENMGSGAAGMFETSMVAILVSAICALIREYGGFEALLGWIKKAFRGKRGGQIGMGLLVGAMDIATANNTVAIVMANPIAKEMSEEYGITPRKAASLLDTFSCIFQGIIPYGAQMLVAISAAHELGYAISAFDIIPNLFYPYLLAVSSFFFIAIDGTLYLGDRLFPGVRELLSAIRARGGQYRFLTNNSSRSVAAYVEKFTRLGIATEAADFLTSVDALIHYLREHGGEDRRYYVCGTESMKSQLRAAGFTVAERREDANALLMGFDTELTFQKLEDACILLGQGIPYLATNPDWVCPTAYGFVPDCGSVCEMLWRATSRRPIVIGKPEPLMPQLAMLEASVSAQETLLVGDRIYTDIASGANAGIDTLLVLSGETKEEDLPTADPQPTFVLPDVAALLNILKS